MSCAARAKPLYSSAMHRTRQVIELSLRASLALAGLLLRP
jgi:hypothetical protein